MTSQSSALTLVDVSGKLDELEDLSFGVSQEILRSHHYEGASYRLDECKYSGVGKHRILLRICIDFLNGSWSHLVRFHQSCNRRDAQPHLEDLESSTVFVFVASVLAILTAHIIKKGFGWLSEMAQKRKRKDEDWDSQIEELSAELLPALSYVLELAVVREMLNRSLTEPQWDCSVTSKQAGALRRTLDRLLDGQTDAVPTSSEGADEVVRRWLKFRREYFAAHGLPTDYPARALQEEIVDSVIVHYIRSRKTD